MGCRQATGTGWAERETTLLLVPGPPSQSPGTRPLPCESNLHRNCSFQPGQKPFWTPVAWQMSKWTLTWPAIYLDVKFPIEPPGAYLLLELGSCDLVQDLYYKFSNF